MQVIPGYQGMNARQRNTLLTLHEHGQLGRTVHARELAGAAWRVWDGEADFIIHPDGEHERIIK